MKIDFPVRQPSGQHSPACRHLTKSYGTQEIFRNISFQVERGQRLVVDWPQRRRQDNSAAHPAGPDPAQRGHGHAGRSCAARLLCTGKRGPGLHQHACSTEATQRAARGCQAGAGGLGPLPVQWRPGVPGSGHAQRRREDAPGAGEAGAGRAELLVLDEPTTPPRRALAHIIGEALGNYNGTIIAVTHDVEFVRHLQPDTLLLMPRGPPDALRSEHDELLARA